MAKAPHHHWTVKKLLENYLPLRAFHRWISKNRDLRQQSHPFLFLR